MARAKGFRSNQNYILICTDGIKYHGFTRGYLLPTPRVRNVGNSPLW